MAFLSLNSCYQRPMFAENTRFLATNLTNTGHATHHFIRGKWICIRKMCLPSRKTDMMFCDKPHNGPYCLYNCSYIIIILCSCKGLHLISFLAHLFHNNYYYEISGPRMKSSANPLQHQLFCKIWKKKNSPLVCRNIIYLTFFTAISL